MILKHFQISKERKTGSSCLHLRPRRGESGSAKMATITWPANIVIVASCLEMTVMMMVLVMMMVMMMLKMKRL